MRNAGKLFSLGLYSVTPSGRTLVPDTSLAIPHTKAVSHLTEIIYIFDDPVSPGSNNSQVLPN